MRTPPGLAKFIPKMIAKLIPSNTKALAMGEPGTNFEPKLEYSALNAVIPIPPAK